MIIDLSLVGMEKGQQYEAIITTVDDKGNKNAAPIGIICKEKDKILCRIFEGSTTLNNIVLNEEFIVNITTNPCFFTFSTIGNIPENFFMESDSNLPILNGVDAYIKCKVINVKSTFKKTIPNEKPSEAKIILSDVEEIILNNKCAKAANRGFYSLIESLVNFTRIDKVDNEKKEYFIDRFKESQRIINKVGSNEEKKAIDFLGETLINKGYKID